MKAITIFRVLRFCVLLLYIYGYFFDPEIKTASAVTAVSLLVIREWLPDEKGQGND